ncbi:hypothetical protein LCGC14_1149110 [marine sediment metagenome]|uniref:Uncharacterized protein n=1 Tax=marine sediment metagenome TaxID=412755 RepID=A0A0F9PE87_9ZZZZ
MNYKLKGLDDEDFDFPELPTENPSPDTTEIDIDI